LFGLCAVVPCTYGTSGVDTSMANCGNMNLGTWQCLVNNGYHFAIVQTWDGGYQMNPNIASCVGDAWRAGMQHVDVYAFMCPNCAGNNPPSSAVATIHQSLANQGVRFGMLWFDVEQCDGCWNDIASNCQFLVNAVHAAESFGFNVGIYSSIYEWQQTVGTCAYFTNHGLWYAHYDGQPNFGDAWAYQFGGWTKPAMKQYDDSGPCTTVDVNWYPDSSFPWANATTLKKSIGI